MPFPRIVRPTQQRRDEVLDAAQRLFATIGYEATSVNQIICEVGISKGAFYHYFQSKEDLIEALACRFASVSAAQVAEVMEDPTLDSFARLSTVLLRFRRHKLQTASEMRAAFEPLLKPENLLLFERTNRSITEVIRPLLTRIIAEGVAEQTFDTPDPELAAETIMHLLVSTRDLVAKLFAARGRAEFEVISAELVRRYTYLGTVVDRILGLPEGSIELTDEESMCLLAGSVGTDTAA